jgi:hypothetical protein
MSEHQEIHRQAARALNDVEATIDALVSQTEGAADWG